MALALRALLGLGMIGAWLALPGSAQAVIIWGQGETFLQVRELPPVDPAMERELQHQLFPSVPRKDIVIAYKFSRFHIFWANLWTWDGSFIIHGGGDRYVALTPELRAALKIEEKDLSVPFLYRFPLGLIILGVFMVLGLLQSLLSRKDARVDNLMGQAHYQQALQAYEKVLRDPEGQSAPFPTLLAQASGERRDKAFAAALASLGAAGVPAPEAEANLQLILDAALKAAPSV